MQISNMSMNTIHMLMWNTLNVKEKKSTTLTGRPKRCQNENPNSQVATVAKE